MKKVIVGLVLILLSTTLVSFGVFAEDSPLDSDTRPIADIRLEPVELQPERVLLPPPEEIDISIRAIPFNRGKNTIMMQHPVIDRADDGTLLKGMEYYNDVVMDDSIIYWLSSTDDGGSWSTAYGFDVYNATYPSLDYYDSGTTFFGTFVSPASFLAGAGVVLLEFGDADDPETWLPYWTDFSDNGWHSMSMSDIAADNSQQSWNWGLISLVMSYDDGMTVVDDAPHIYSHLSSLGHVQLSWYPQYPGCRTTDVDIDPTAAKTYAVYDRYYASTDQWRLFVRQDYFNDWMLPTDAASIFFADSSWHLQNPAIAAHGDTVIILAEAHHDSSVSDTMIVCWSTFDGDVDDLDYRGVIIEASGAETAPRISHADDGCFICTFVRNGWLYSTTACDGGISWTEPVIVSDPIRTVRAEYRCSDLSEDGQRAIYQVGTDGIATSNMQCADDDLDNICDCLDNCPAIYNPDQTDSDDDSVGDECDLCPGFDDSADSDGDGSPDGCDNCPEAANEGQQDADGDGIGDACDPCTDVDGDGFGQEYYPANECPDDNCPFVYNPDQDDFDDDGAGDLCDNCYDVINPDQEDIDEDGIGDICDECVDHDGDGYGNPGYPMTTCEIDNCPGVFNPDQADSNSDGTGDLCDYPCGDANNDGDVNVGDAVYVIAYIFAGGPPPPSWWAADVNGDGDVNVGDAVYLVSYIFRGGPAPDCF